MDIGCRRPLDPLLDFPALMPRTWPYGVSNDLMASAPQHPFIIKVALGLQDHNENYLSKYLTVFFTTGPMFLSAILKRWLWIQQQGYMDPLSTAHGVAILPSMMYDTTDYSFFAHYRGSSWHGNDVAVTRFMYRHLWGFVLAAGGLAWLVRAMYKTQTWRRRMYRVRSLWLTPRVSSSPPGTPLCYP